MQKAGVKRREPKPRKTTEISLVRQIVERKSAPRNTYKRIYFSEQEYDNLLAGATAAGYHIEGVTDEACAVEAFVLSKAGVAR